ncbi:hypothetical protein GXW83_27975 [Streptacidiphilus sp. PB12-B1b]|uniref:hypothetical protein n=1 Tax=Streptacidiphilus sp. PB12-B1b TaxID=2705012 RepID=UPI0015F7C8D6|nr:hypothetical protein [Streptacidiphilus sp. PB12-B1b]QMU78971.1 hypothetical protein GXW83_27975 [Streptacidiphilus sp. PB12-B1b]
MSGIDDARDLQQSRQQQQRSSVLARTDNGHAGPTGYTTDFTADDVGGLDGLRAMIENADPAVLDTVAGHWLKINKALVAVQSDFQTHTSAALEHWEGAAADGFAARAQQLHESLGNGAQYAANAHEGVTVASTALRAAKKAMPKDPSEWQKISRKATSETNDHQFKADLKSGMSRQSAIALDGGELSADEEAHQRAIVVMQTLEGSYGSAAKKIGEPPARSEDQTVWPPPPATVTHDPVDGTDGGTVAGPGHGGTLRLTQDGDPDSVGSEDGLTPGQGGHGSPVDPGDGGDGISGGEKLPPAPGEGTTLTGIPGGLGTVPGGGSGGTPGAVGGGLFGVGGGSGGRRGSGSGLSLGFAVPGQLGDADGESYGLGGGSLGQSGLADGADDFEAGSARSGTGSGYIEEDAARRQAETAEAEASESERGMGGIPGGLGGQEKKRKRRPRPHYLVEDPESWASGVTVNPPVIM